MTEPLSVGAVRQDDFRRIREVFEAALERPPVERPAFVRAACGGDAALHAEVERMLAADATEDPLLDAGAYLSADRFRAGATVANLRIVSTLGRGGMGEVYRAYDATLNRDVALKVLPESVALDPDRLARFRREAQVLASLNHPNIAAIHAFAESLSTGSEQQPGVQAIVMELVEGPTLADRIGHGAIPVDEALPIAKQIAQALEAAHEQGVVHRDLKPANIKLRPDGTVKVLDFGLAKVLQPQLATGDATALPTITSASMVQRGVILGTAAYTSPAQAKGREADKRSDVWAFGAVLYEMLSGQRAFKGKDTSDTLASVLRQEIDWSEIPPATPAMVRRLMARCLDRDVRRRLRDIGEARIALEDMGAATVEESRADNFQARALAKHPSRRVGPVVFSAILAGALGAAAVWTLRPSPPLAVSRLTFNLPDGAALFANRSVVAISPDGTQVVYVTPAGLHLRSMSAFDAQLIRGSESIFNITEPAFSQDGRSIVFHTTADQTLKRMPVTGGAAVTMAQATYPYGLSWGPDGIVFVEPGNATLSEPDRLFNRIMRVSQNGGAAELLVRLNEGEVAHGPQLLPGGKQLLFTLATRTTPDRWDRASIVVQSLASGERKTLIEGGSDARYVPTGHVVYAVRGSLFAIAFDVERLEVRSAPVSVVEGIGRADASSSGGAHYSFAGNGTLVYVAGPSVPRRDIALTDRKGRIERLGLPPHLYEVPRVSPDGTRVAVGTDDGNEAVIWMYRLSGGSAIQRVTFGGNNRFPVWSSDGTRVAFQSDRDGDHGIFWQLADGTGTAERLTTPGQGESHEPEAWSPNGNRLLFSITKESDTTLWTFSLKDRNATPFGDVHSSMRTGAVFSPDGRWVAYASSEGRKKTIFVQPFPAGTKHQLVANEFEQPNHPLWSADGRELFYNPGPGEFASVRVSTQPTFAFGKPIAVPRPFAAADTRTRRPYDITPDGRFVSAIDDGPSASGRPTAPQIHVILNWFEELRARVPSAHSTR